MYTKVLAAKKVAKSNTNTIIASGKEKNILIKLGNGENIGTFIYY
jgi:glutamate 5-kinase